MLDLLKEHKKTLLLFVAPLVIVGILFFVDSIVFRIGGGILVVLYLAFLYTLVTKETKPARPETKPYIQTPVSTAGFESPPEENDDDFSYTPGAVAEDEGDFTIIKTFAGSDSGSFGLPSAHLVVKGAPEEGFSKDEFLSIISEEVPEDLTQPEELSFHLEKLLRLLRDSTNAYSAVLFWYNAKRSRFTIDTFSSASKDIAKIKIDMASDVLNLVVENKEPLLKTDIPLSAERDLIRYYPSPQGIKCFAGAPILYHNKLIGILAIDSKENDAFGYETVYVLARYIYLINNFVSLFEARHNKNASVTQLKALLSFQNDLSSLNSGTDLPAFYERHLRNLIKYDVLTVVQYSKEHQSYFSSRIYNNTSLKYIGEGLEIEQTNTITYKVIQDGEYQKIDDIAGIPFKRFSKLEDISFDGSFLAVPVVYERQVHAVLCFESMTRGAFSRDDIALINLVAYPVAQMLASGYVQNYLKQYIAIDLATGVLNTPTFIKRLKEDLQRSYDLKIPGTLAIIKIDKFRESETLFTPHYFDEIAGEIIKMLEPEIKYNMMLGRMNEDTLAVYFFNFNSKDVYLWGEKFRLSVSKKTFSTSMKQSSFTVSIGIASTTGKTVVEDVMKSARLAMEKAVELGGNKVRNLT